MEVINVQNPAIQAMESPWSKAAQCPQYIWYSAMFLKTEVYGQISFSQPFSKVRTWFNSDSYPSVQQCTGLLHCTPVQRCTGLYTYISTLGHFEKKSLVLVLGVRFQTTIENWQYRVSECSPALWSSNTPMKSFTFCLLSDFPLFLLSVEMNCSGCQSLLALLTCLSKKYRSPFWLQQETPTHVMQPPSCQTSRCRSSNPRGSS